MAKFSNKVMGKEVGQASIYATPHTMAGTSLGPKDAMKAVSGAVDPNTLSAKQTRPSSQAMRVSAGDPGRDDVKTSGIKMRGTGAATKGLMSRGPMA